MLQVLLRAELGDSVSGELALEGAAKPLAIFQPRTAPVGIAIRRIGQIEQRQGSGQGAEALNFDLQAAAPFAADAADAADEIFGVVPAFDGHDTAARGQGKVGGDDGERVVARFEENGLAGGG